MINFLIIVPTLNSYKLLPNLIRSLNEQTYKNWRLVFVDGKSNPDHKKYLNTVCKENKKFKLLNQSKSSKGIYGAMNDGIAFSTKNDCILFWGSDDWADNKNILLNLSKLINKFHEEFDLIIGGGTYYNLKSQRTRISKFNYFRNFNLSLLLGSSPPHQGTIFSHKAISKLSFFDENITLSADLDYFLKISKFNDLQIKIYKGNIVKMREGGISGRESKKKFAQVLRCYKRRYRYFWLFTFIMRYFRRLLDLIK